MQRFLDRRSTALGAPNAFGRLTGRVLERLRGSSGTLSDGSWTLLARPGRPKIGLGAPFGRPKAVPSTSGRVSETALVAQGDPRSIFRRFWSDLAWISVDFRPTFRRFFARAACDETTESRALASSRRVPRRWSNVFRNDRRTLDFQLNVVAYPQST